MRPSSRPCPPCSPSVNFNIEKGRDGEDRARSYLESKGYRFLCANYRTRLGELDLVMRHKDTIVFVEVKARRDASFGAPQEAVTFAKQRKMIRVGLEYAKARRCQGTPFRFDVVALTPDGIEHIENAVDASAGGYTL
ncbi:MAG: YraN family protein [Elusimicrobia bacterium]|nr:YraN family protein [Elusimicrobiota bacterium]